MSVRVRLAALLCVVLSAVVLAPASAGAAGATGWEKKVARLLTAKTNLSTASTTARCLSTQSVAALRAGRAPKGAVLARRCKTSKVVVSRVAEGSKSLKATVKALRGSRKFKRSLSTHAHLGVAVATVKGRRMVVAAAARGGAETPVTPGTQGHGPIPTADFTYILDDRTLRLDGSGSADDKGIVSFTWMLAPADDSSKPVRIGQGIRLDHSVPAYGDYRVTLTVTDASGSTGSMMRTVAVWGSTPAPNASFTQRVDYRTSQRTVVLDASSAGPAANLVAWDWHVLGADSTKTHIGSGPRLVWTAPTSDYYRFSLTVTDAQGRTDDYSPGMALDVTDRVTRAEFQPRLMESMDALRASEGGLPPLAENTCLAQAAQKQAEALADLHTDAAPLDLPALGAACGVAARGGFSTYAEEHYWITFQVFTSNTAMASFTDKTITQYGLGFMHSRNGWPGYYAVLITAS